jgi:hypothetical protein
MSLARFKVMGRFDKAGGAPIPATLVINRDNGVVTVRPLRRRHVYTGTLDSMVEMLVQRNIAANIAPKRGR